MKELILKGYELVPEAYRQKFRNCQKDSSQTFMEFARIIEQIFDRWCMSEKVEGSYEKLQQLILIEEFKRCLGTNVKMYVEEQELNH